MIARPRITIVTPVLNGESFLADALDSIAAQNYPETEHIVYDGGSTDGTAAILDRYPHVRVIAGKDRGPHDVMNRGIAAASGDIIAFLNADDVFPAGVFAACADRFAADSALDIVAGASAIVDDGPLEKAHILVRRSHDRDGSLAYDELFLGAPAFNTRFFRRGLFDRTGTFDLGYFYGADRDFLIRARLAGARAVTLDRITCVFRSHARSRTIDPAQKSADAIIREHLTMAKALAPRLARKPDARGLLRQWHAFECFRSAGRRLKRGQTGAMTAALAEGFAFDPAFPLSCAGGWKTWRTLRQREDRRPRPLAQAL